MELKNLSKCTLFLSKFIKAKSEYFYNKYFINMYTEIPDDSSFGKLYLAYKFTKNDKQFNDLFKVIQDNPNYYSFCLREIDGIKVFIIIFRVSFKEWDILENAKKYGLLDYYDKDNAVIWKYNLEEFYDICDNMRLGDKLNNKLIEKKSGINSTTLSVYYSKKDSVALYKRVASSLSLPIIYVS